MLVDLVQTTTRDGVRLDGAFQSRPPSGPPAIPLDGICMIHGTGGNFYSSTLFDSFAAPFLDLGCAVLGANTRGHDGISTAATPSGGKRLGAAYEAVDDCRHDLAAWIAWLRERAGPRIGLLGHSLGAVKCIYALTRDPEFAVACLIALSPPRLSYSWFCASPEGADFLETYALAERHMGAGQPTALLDVKQPLPYVVTAAGYIEKYGPDERYNYLQLAGALRCPALITLGSLELEKNMAFRGAVEALQQLTQRNGLLHVEVVPGADHFYSGARREVVAVVESWLRSHLPAR